MVYKYAINRVGYIAYFKKICYNYDISHIRKVVYRDLYFFGHRAIPKNIENELQIVLIDLIKNKDVNLFYVGNNGDFDALVRKELNLLKSTFPHINYYVVLAYMPKENNILNTYNFSDTIYPDGLEFTPPKYAIDKRNRWMLNKSDYVVTYVKTTFGGAYKFKKLAEKKGKTVINLADK